MVTDVLVRSKHGSIVAQQTGLSSSRSMVKIGSSAQNANVITIFQLSQCA